MHRVAVHRESRSGIRGGCGRITKSDWGRCLLLRGEEVSDFGLPRCT
jgi:hypothetical protein